MAYESGAIFYLFHGAPGRRCHAAIAAIEFLQTPEGEDAGARFWKNIELASSNCLQRNDRKPESAIFH